jgi:hypothetical protein
MNWTDLSRIVLKNPQGAIVNSNGLPWTGTQYFPASHTVFPKNINENYPYPGNNLSYSVLLPKTDVSGIGNDIGGIPTPEMSAPLFTERGYNTYIQGYDNGGTVYLGSSSLPLSANTAFTNDTRPTIETLYSDCVTWSNTWINSMKNNVDNKWMISENIFPYDNVCYTNRGAYQTGLLNTKYGVPIN